MSVFLIFQHLRSRQLFLNYRKTDSLSDSVNSETNEIQGLAGILESSESKIEKLQKDLVSQLFVLACSRTILSSEEEQNLKEGLNYIRSPYRVISICTENKEETLDLLNQIQTTASTAAYSAIVHLREVIILTSDTSGHLEEIRNIIGQNHHFCCGISAPFEQLDKFQEAVRQARLCRPTAGGVAIYSGSTLAGPFLWKQHEQLYQSLISLQEDSCREILRAIQENTSRVKTEETFYTIRYIIHSAADEVGISLPELHSLEYLPSLPERENIQKLFDTITLFYERFHRKNAAAKVSECERILLWIDENCPDCNLNIAMITAQFSISEKGVYNIVKQATGKSVQEYILSVRMEKVAEQIRNTDDGIQEIAQRCGYPSASTFYRVFKKYYGITPLQYKEQFNSK